MDDDVARILSAIDTFEKLRTFEGNVRRLNKLSPEIQTNIDNKAIELGRVLIAEKTGIDLSDLSPAEERIVQAVSTYVGIKKARGSHSQRTLDQIKNRGLIGAAEASVCRSKPTTGYTTLAEEGFGSLSYEQIVVDNPDEFTDRAQRYARRALGLGDADKGKTGVEAEEHASQPSNPNWSRDEHILALDLYMRFRERPMAKDSDQVINLSKTLRALAAKGGVEGSDTFRNPNGVYMKLMNFQRLDPGYTVRGRVGLTAGNKLEDAVWNEYSDAPESLKIEVDRILAKLTDDEGLAAASVNDIEPYWVFVCNPKKWAIDRFLESGVSEDSWGIRPSDEKRFAPGQLGLVRVGVDHRTIIERDGKPALEPGIYALCEILTPVYPGTGASDSYWNEGENRVAGWPTVDIKYLRDFHNNPLTIERLRTERPGLSHLLLNGFQAASFPISSDDFHSVMDLLGEDLDTMEPMRGDGAKTLAELAALEKHYANASPEVKTRVSKSVERGPIGNAVKRANGYKCQLCNAMGLNPIGFVKRGGDLYVEAHHVMPVSTNEAGTLSALNVVTLCANHHRQVHYGNVSVVINEASFKFVVDGKPFIISKTILPEEPVEHEDDGAMTSPE